MPGPIFLFKARRARSTYEAISKFLNSPVTLPLYEDTVIHMNGPHLNTEPGLTQPQGLHPDAGFSTIQDCSKSFPFACQFMVFWFSRPHGPRRNASLKQAQNNFVCASSLVRGLKQEDVSGEDRGARNKQRATVTENPPAVTRACCGFLAQPCSPVHQSTPPAGFCTLRLPALSCQKGLSPQPAFQDAPHGQDRQAAPLGCYLSTLLQTLCAWPSLPAAFSENKGSAHPGSCS